MSHTDPKRPLSIKEIAAKAGVSVATVSRVINRSGYVARDTEARVRAVIEEYRYVPNLVARGLRTSQSPIVGIVIPDITNEFFADIVLAIQTQLFEHGLFTIICNTNESAEQEQAYLQMLAAQNISGLVYIAGNPTEEGATLSVPTVYVDRRPPRDVREDAVLIESENEAGGYMAARELLSKGCHRIAILTEVRDISSHRQRHAGYCRALAEAGLSPDAPDLCHRVRHATFAKAQRIVSDLSAASAVDGIFCTSDILALGAVSALLQKGVKVPQSVRVVGFDDISQAQHSAVPLTTVRQATDEMGRQAVGALLEMMHGKTTPKRRISLPVTLIQRAST